MTKTGVNALITGAVIVLIAVVVGIGMLLSPGKIVEPEYLNTDFVDEVLGDNTAKASAPVNGDMASIQIGSNVTQLTAEPNEGYVFAYWQVNSNSTSNANLKLCADEVIRVDSNRDEDFTPIFIAESNVINITSLQDSKLTSAISGNTTAGKIFNLTQDCTLTGTFAPLGKFCGILKGNGHKVMGLNINHTATGTGTGIFTELDGAVISDIIIASGTVTSVRASTGSIAGVINNSCLSRCVSNVSITSTNVASVVGGLVGSTGAAKSTIYCSEFGGSVSGVTASGIIGNSNNVMLYKNKYNGAVL